MAFPANINLSSLDGSNGFTVSGAATGDLAGFSVASAGDVNGDGFVDLIIGARDADPNGSNSGASYVVFGKASGFTANIELSTLNGTTGFKLSGVGEDQRSGISVASAGDVNGDGFDDLIVGAYRASGTGKAENNVNSILMRSIPGPRLQTAVFVICIRIYRSQRSRRRRSEAPGDHPAIDL